MKMKESDLYAPVEKFLQDEYYCFYHCQEAGKHGFGSVDVFGVRYKNSEKSEIETIGVEVKPYKHAICANFGQAKGYSLFCDKVYFAFPRFEVTEDDKEAANRLGVGLIKIEGENPNFVCKEVLQAPTSFPIDKLRSYVLGSKRIYQCESCKVFQQSKKITRITDRIWSSTKKEINNGKDLRVRNKSRKEFYCNACAKKKFIS